MKWVVSSIQIGHETYELWSENEKLLTLEFHPTTHSARLITTERKRVFQFRKEGFRKNKTVLRNEYGIQMGRLEYEKKNSNTGVFEIDEEKFSFGIDHHPYTALKIYRQFNETPFASCTVTSGDKSKPIAKETLRNTEHILLLTFGWHILTSAKQKTNPIFVL